MRMYDGKIGLRLYRTDWFPMVCMLIFLRPRRSGITDSESSGVINPVFQTYRIVRKKANISIF